MHTRRAASIIDITALCYISFYVSAFCHAARLSVSNVRPDSAFRPRASFPAVLQRKRPSGSNHRRSTLLEARVLEGHYLQDAANAPRLSNE